MATAGRSARRAHRRSRRGKRGRKLGAVATWLAAGVGGSVLILSGHRRLAEVVGVGVGATAAVLTVSWWLAGDPDRWLRGAEAEMATEVLLEALPRRTWRVWHDLAIPGSRANIDHVAVGPTGVWVVDTKATRGQVRFGWRRVHLAGHQLDCAPLLWEAEVVADRLGAAGVDVAASVVRPIVAVHGSPDVATPMRRRGGRSGRVRVVPARRLVRRLERGRRRLRRREVRAVWAAMDSVAGWRGTDRVRHSRA